MPPKNVNISLDKMEFTNQKNFLNFLSNSVFSLSELKSKTPKNRTHISTSDVFTAIKESMFSEYSIGKILSNFSKDNIKNISEYYLESIKDLIRNGKMSENIQTKDNDFGTPEYNHFVNSELDERLIEELGMLSDKDRNSLLNYEMSEKDTISNFFDSLTSEGLIDHIKGLYDELFPKHIIKAKDHDYNTKAEEKLYKSNKEMNDMVNKAISDIDLAKSLKNKPNDGIPEETKKESVIAYAKAIKEMNDLLDKRPWYKRWFSSTHKGLKKAIEKSKEGLYVKGITKESLDKFMKSAGDEASLDQLYNANENNIKKVNQKNKERLEKAIAEQEDINIKNFFKEQEINKKAKETLDKANVITDYYPLEEEQQAKNDKVYLEQKVAYLTEKVYNMKYSEEKRAKYAEDLKSAEAELKKISEMEFKGVIREEDEMDNLEFNSKDILESSDELQKDLDAEFDIDFEKDVADALEIKIDEKEIINEIEF